MALANKLKQLIQKHKGVLLTAGIFILAKILDTDIPFILFGLSLVDNFDSYSDGDLNGQGNWSGAVAFDVQGTVVQAGAKAVKWTASSATHVIDNSFTGGGDVNWAQSFYMRLSKTNPSDYDEAQLLDGATIITGVLMNTDGFFYLRTTGGAVTKGDAYSANTFYKITVEGRTSDDYVRLLINDIESVTWQAPWNAWSDYSAVKLIGYGDGDWYFDSFSDPNAGSFSPSISPSTSPSQSISPSLSPSLSPSYSPSYSPSLSPSLSPSPSPSASESISPSISPSLSPSLSPSYSPSLSPSISPSTSPSQSISPSISPSYSPSYSPSLSPSLSQSLSPSISQSYSPSLSPSISPSKSPSISPSYSPSLSPSVSPSPSPTLWTWQTKNTASWTNQTKNTSSWTWVPKRGL